MTTVAEKYGEAPPDYRLPSDTRLGRVCLQVADLARSVRHYRDVLGLRVLSDVTGRTVLGAHGDETPLVELLEHKGAKAVPQRGRLGLYHFALLLPDRAALGHFARHLADMQVRAGASDHLVSEAFYLRDPDGLGIEVYADRPRAEWQVSEGQVRMTTEPLDVADLVRVAGDASWTGMPAGTRVGHVHLHVGDLGEAAAFYHHALGFDKTVWNYPGALFVSAGGYHHHLGLNTWAADAPAAGPNDARLLEWEVVTPTPAAAAASLQAHGYSVTQEGATWLATDPWGTTLRLRS